MNLNLKQIWKTRSLLLRCRKVTLLISALITGFLSTIRVTLVTTLVFSPEILPQRRIASWRHCRLAKVDYCGVVALANLKVPHFRVRCTAVGSGKAIIPKSGRRYLHYVACGLSPGTMQGDEWNVCTNTRRERLIQQEERLLVRD
jgi:hypothetical protein